MRPRSSGQSPAKHHAKCPHDEPWIEPARDTRHGPDRIFAVNGANRWAEYLVRSLRLARKRRDDDPHERDCRTHRVADGRPATACVPSIEALGREPYADNALLTLTKGKRGRRHLDDVRPAMLVEKVGTVEVVQERLAIVAVADGAVHPAWRGVCDLPANLAAATMELGVLAHLLRAPA